jgi:hypothetical protein
MRGDLEVNRQLCFNGQGDGLIIAVWLCCRHGGGGKVVEYAEHQEHK